MPHLDEAAKEDARFVLRVADHMFDARQVSNFWRELCVPAPMLLCRAPRTSAFVCADTHGPRCRSRRTKNVPARVNATAPKFNSSPIKIKGKRKRSKGTSFINDACANTKPAPMKGAYRGMWRQASHSHFATIHGLLHRIFPHSSYSYDTVLRELGVAHARSDRTPRGACLFSVTPLRGPDGG